MSRKFDSKNVEDILPLSDVQSGMLIYFLKNPKSDIYFEKIILNINGYIDEKIFVDTWKEIIGNNEMLRSTIAWENIDAPIQIILKEHPGNIEIYDENQDFLFNDIDLKVSMYDVPFKIILFKYSKNRYKLAICSHHILFDGWSTSIILKEFISTYKSICCNEEIKNSPKGKYKDYIRKQKKLDKGLHKKYWNNFFHNFQFGNSQCFCFKDYKKTEKKIMNTSFLINNEFELNQYINENQITLAAYLYAGWAVLINQYTKQCDVSFGTTVSGRKLLVKGIENIVGLFINTVPLRLQIDSNEGTRDFLLGVKKILEERGSYEGASIIDIKQYCGCNDELFDSIVVIENYPLDRLELENECDFELVPDEQKVQGEYNLIVNIAVLDRLCITIAYNQFYIDTDIVIAIGDYYKNILEMLFKTDKLSDINLMSNQNLNYLEFSDFDF